MQLKEGQGHRPTGEIGHEHETNTHRYVRDILPLRADAITTTLITIPTASITNITAAIIGKNSRSAPLLTAVPITNNGRVARRDWPPSYWAYSASAAKAATTVTVATTTTSILTTPPPRTT